MTQPEPGKSPQDIEFGAQLSFFAELKKRRVYQSAVAYAIVAWGATEILEGVIAGLGWPDWLATLAVILFVMGFPVAMFLAWVFDWTPEGIQRTAPSGALGWLPIVAAFVFLIAGSAGLFWLINPSGIIRVEQIGVAVLPCRYRGDPENEFRGSGIAEVLNDRLAHSENLFVPAFTSVLRMSAMSLETAQLAEALQVSWLIECRVSEQDERLSIDASIVEVATDESSALISSRVRSLEIIDTINGIEIAVFNRFDIPVIHGTHGQFRGTLTSSMRAFDQYLLGQRSMHSATADSFTEARRHFRDAQGAGPFTMARVREADAMLALFETDPPASASAQAATFKAIGLMLDEVARKDVVPAELYASRLRLANLTDGLGSETPVDDAQRIEWLQHATTLKPNFAEPYLLYAEYLLSEGRNDDAREYLAKARKLAPDSQ